MKLVGNGDSTPENVTEMHFKELIEVMRKSTGTDLNSWNDSLADDNCAFEKIILTSFNFGLTSPKQIRVFFEEILSFASSSLLFWD
jgi:hypothetical protein